jgi:hypothetical protein
MEEDVDQSRSNAIRPRNDNTLRITVQIPLLPLQLRTFLVRVQDPGVDIGLSGGIFPAFINLRLDPAPELQIVADEDRDALEEGQEPGKMGEVGDVIHVRADRLGDVRLFPFGEHVRGLDEG